MGELLQQTVVGRGSSGNVFKALHTPTGTHKNIPIYIHTYRYIPIHKCTHKHAHTNTLIRTIIHTSGVEW